MDNILCPLNLTYVQSVGKRSHFSMQTEMTLWDVYDHDILSANRSLFKLWSNFY